MKFQLHGLIAAACLVTIAPANATPPIFEKRVEVVGPDGSTSGIALVQALLGDGRCNVGT